MSTFASWRPRYRAMCPEPGPEDLFVVVFINGRRVGIHPAADHAKWRWAAEQLAESQQCQVKVLPMAGAELMTFLGMEPEPPQPIEKMEPAEREVFVGNCMEVLREGGTKEERELALDLLKHLGALQ